MPGDDINPATPYAIVGPADAPMTPDDVDPAIPEYAVGPADAPVFLSGVGPAIPNAVSCSDDPRQWRSSDPR